LSRIGFNVDILKLLPPGLHQVEGLSLYLGNFARPDELIVTVEADDAESAKSAARTLAKSLREQPLLAGKVIDEPPWETDPAQLSEFLAYLLVNQDPSRRAALGQRLSVSGAGATVRSSLEEIGSTFSMRDMLLVGADPYRLASDLPGSELFAGVEQAGFASADGTFRIVYVTSPAGFTNYRETAEWLAKIRDLCASSVRGRSVRLGFTGEPAFVAEIATGMQRDMVVSAIGTLGLITLLFWLCYRRVEPLIWLVLLLQLVFLLSLATAGFLLHRLTAIGAGFASVMIGLSVDYGYFVYQRSLGHGGDVRSLRRDCLRNILWTSGTTAAAFFSLNLSSLPGLSQFGNMVGIGVCIGAAVMLGVYAPLALRFRQPASARPVTLPPGAIVPERFSRAGEWVVSILVLALLGSLAWKGFPKGDFSPSSLRPRDSASQRTLDEMSRRLGGGDDGRLNLVVSGRNEEEVLERLQSLQGKIDAARARGDLKSALSPLPLWPDRKNQTANLAALGGLAPELPRLKQTLLDNGFNDDAFSLTASVFGKIRDWGSSAPSFWPGNDASRWILERMVRHANGQYLALGLLEASPGREGALADELSGEGIYPVSWGMLGRELAGSMPGEIMRISLALMVGILAILAFGLRSIRALSLFAVTTLLVLGCLAGAMSLFGMNWGFFNLAAVLLLLGTGTDYSILLLLSLKRNGGDVPAARRELGTVILLCSVSAAAGFGSLAWAGNQGLAALGKTCALGLLIDALISYFLLPRAWSLLQCLRPAKPSSRQGI
jgi:predicted exporter